MIEYKFGDILEEDTDAIVNTVNCVGVMGRGIALQFKNAHPENFKAYTEACKAGKIVPGKMFAYKTDKVISPKYIINFPTKRHWKGKSRMEDIDAGLIDLASMIHRLDLRSIAIPPLGCGLGGLNWNEVRKKIEGAMSHLSDVRILVFEPKGAPNPTTMRHVRDVPSMTPGRAALVSLTSRYLGGLLDPFITLLEIHKLMYFMQEAGESLRLDYIKGTYGPYAANLRHVLNTIEGHYVFGYADGGDNPHKRIQLVASAVDEAEAFLAGHTDTLARLGRVADLVDGFESAFGLELLSTVYWILRNEGVKTRDDVIQRTYAWNERKQQMFSSRQIILASNVLIEKGWITPFC